MMITPSVTATGPLLTLAELRELVEATQHLPPETVVRGRTTQNFGEMFNKNGHGLSVLTVDPGVPGGR